HPARVTSSSRKGERSRVIGGCYRGLARGVGRVFGHYGLPPPRDLPAEGARAPPTGTLERSGDCRFCDRPPVCPKRRPIDAQAQPPRETLVGVTLESLSLLGTGRPKIRTCPQLLGGYP